MVSLYMFSCLFPDDCLPPARPSPRHNGMLLAFSSVMLNSLSSNSIIDCIEVRLVCCSTKTLQTGFIESDLTEIGMSVACCCQQAAADFMLPSLMLKQTNQSPCHHTLRVEALQSAKNHTWHHAHSPAILASIHAVSNATDPTVCLSCRQSLLPIREANL